MIVKVQISDRTENGSARLLVYQEGRVGMYETTLNRRMRIFFNYCGGQFKKFYHAELVDRRYQIGAEAPEQEW